MVQLNFTEQLEWQQNETRLACVSCISEKIGPFIQVSTVKERWQDYKSHKNQVLKVRKEEIKMKIGSVQSQLEQLLEKYSEIITQVLQSLSQRQIHLQQQNEKEFNDPEKDWLNLSKKEILAFADTLSQPNHKEILKSEIKQEFEQQDYEIIEIIEKTLLELHSVENKKQRNILEAIYMEGKQIICEVETQTSIAQQISTECQIIPQLQLFSDISCICFEQSKPQPNEVGCQYIERDCECSANYQIIEKNSIVQNGRSFEIAFNNNSTIMVAGCEAQIKVFSFNKGKLKELQVLSDHSSSVLTCYFMKNSNQFFSGSQDNSIRLWSYNNEKQWFCSQILAEGHEAQVNKIIMNQNEDLLISCSHDYTIKFWRMTDQWSCSQTLSVHTHWVWSICLNESENQLVSCGLDNQILICAQNNDHQWAVIQTIKVELYGAKVSFIGDKVIVFQPYNGVKMDIFQLNEESKQFERFSDVKVEKGCGCSYWFQQQFIKSKQLLLNKNGQCVHLMRKNQNTEFTIEQTIYFENCNIWGALSHDGKYLVTWDQASNQIQIRKQQQ